MVLYAGSSLPGLTTTSKIRRLFPRIPDDLTIYTLKYLLSIEDYRPRTDTNSLDDLLPQLAAMIWKDIILTFWQVIKVSEGRERVMKPTIEA